MTERARYQLLLGFLCLKPDEVVDRNFDEVSVNDWNEIVRDANRHGVEPLVYMRLKKSRTHVPPEVLQKLKQAVVHVGFQNTERLHALSQVLVELRKHAIPVIVLKGAHLAELVYESVAMRQMGDVDLLVKEQDVEGTEQALLAMGYKHGGHFKEDSRISSHHLPPFTGMGGLIIEVHWTIPPSDVIRIDMDGIWKRARPATIAGASVLTLSPEDLLLHLSVHVSIHHRFGRGLKPLCDIAETIQRYRNEIDWLQLQQRGRAWGVGMSVYITLRLAKDLLKADVPDDVLRGLGGRDLDPHLVAWAEERVHSQTNDLVDPSSLSPRLAQLWGKSLLGKLKVVAKIVFPSPREMARIYHLPPTSLRVYLSYPVRLKDLLVLRGGPVWRLVRRDKTAMAQADLYQKLVDSQ